MGATLKSLRNIASLISAGFIPPRGRILEYGAQNVFCVGHEAELVDFVGRMRAFNGLDAEVDPSRIAIMAASGWMADLMTDCGFDYTAIDIFESNKTILFDLNADKVPADLAGQFDLVTNFGTTEHILNQYNCFLTAHEFTKTGGLIYHDLPMGGYFFHGYFSYTPMFFMHLADANEYEIVYRYYWKAPGDAGATPAAPELTAHGWPESWVQDWGIEFVFRKTTAAPFRLPIEIGTAAGAVTKDFGAEARLLGRGEAASGSAG